LFGLFQVLGVIIAINMLIAMMTRSFDDIAVCLFGINKWNGGQKRGWKDGRKEERKEGRKEGKREGGKEGRKERWKERENIKNIKNCTQDPYLY